VTVNARAVAGPDEGTGCLYALTSSDKNNNPEFYVPKGTVISVPNCDVVANGDFTVESTANVTAHGVAVTGVATVAPGTLNVTPTPTPTSPDPFADLDEQSLFGSSWTCGWTGTRTNTVGGGGAISVGSGIAGNWTDGNGDATLDNSGVSYTLNPGVYCGGTTGKAGTVIKIGLAISQATKNAPGPCVAGQDDFVVFNPGIYIIVGGGLDWKHSCVYGTGVVFYFTGTLAHPYVSCGSTMLSTDSPDRFFFSAPLATTSGFKKWDGTTTSPAPYEGLLFIQDRRQGTAGSGAFPGVTNCATAPNYIVANLFPQNMTLDGSLYFPNQHILYGATSLAGGNYTILIGGTLEFKGSATFNSNFAGLANGSPIKRPGLGE
jgi:hypothetical protein